MNEISPINFQKKNDWHLVWTAAGVIIPLACLIIGCFWSLNNRLIVIETVMVMQGHKIKGIVSSPINKIEDIK